MDTAVNVFQVLLLIPFAGGGTFKLALPYARFIKMPFQEWSNDFAPAHIRLIGIFEVSAVIGLLAALLIPSLSGLAPFIAIGMALIMAGAMATHLRRSEYLNMVGNATWLAMALFVAYGTLIGFAA